MGNERDDDGLFSGPTLGADGKLENAVDPSAPHTFEPIAPAEAPIELARPLVQAPIDEPQPEPPPPPPRRSNALKVIGAMLVLGVLVLIGALVFKPDVPIPDGVRDSNVFRQLTAAKGQVTIISEPSGAKIFIGDSQVGVTPWSADNRYVGTVDVRLEAKGFSSVSANFQGGKDQTVEVDLKKRESHTR